jgi:hypothetical protein
VAERTPLMQQLDALDRRLGKGATLSVTERALVLKDGVPAWLLVGQRLGSPELADKCGRAIAALGSLRRQVEPLMGATEHTGG